LPPDTPNYVTARGLSRLRAELASLERQRSGLAAESPADRISQLNALNQRLAELQARISSANVVDGRAQPRAEVRFGATVTVRNEQGQDAQYQIVGVDEADASRGLLAFSSPLARALLGKHVNDVVELRTPRESQELEVRAIRYGDGDHEP
jgi:transcription elongation factor GreB